MLKLKKIKAEEQEFEFDPSFHTSPTTATYGGGTSSVFGHVKLTDAYREAGGTASASVGASYKALNDAYNDLKAKYDSLNNVLQYWQLSPSGPTGDIGYPVSQVITEVNTFNNRNFNDFEWLCFVLMEGGYVRNSITIPRKVFAYRDIELFYVDSANKQRYVTIKGNAIIENGEYKLSGTTFSVVTSGTDDKINTTSFAIYGFGSTSKTLPYGS